jgi:RHS repeat-associated protein
LEAEEGVNSPIDLEVPLIRYQLNNHLGSSCVEVDDERWVISYEEYYPYGSTSYRASKQGVEPPKRYRYTGKERDNSTGLHYYGARYYATWLGRWTAVDPVGNTLFSSYSYTCDNPIKLLDPDGAQEKSNSITSGFVAEHWETAILNYYAITHLPKILEGMKKAFAQPYLKLLSGDLSGAWEEANNFNPMFTSWKHSYDAYLHLGNRDFYEAGKSIYQALMNSSELGALVFGSIGMGSFSAGLRVPGQSLKLTLNLPALQLNLGEAAALETATSIQVTVPPLVLASTEVAPVVGNFTIGSGLALSMSSVTSGGSGGGGRNVGTYKNNKGHHVHQAASRSQSGPARKNDPNYDDAITIDLEGEASKWQGPDSTEHGRATAVHREINKAYRGRLKKKVTVGNNSRNQVTIESLGEGTTTPGGNPYLEDIKAFYGLKAADAPGYQTSETIFDLVTRSSNQIDNAGCIPCRVPSR